MNKKNLKKACPNCENPYPHLYANGSGHCEECGESFTNKQ